MALKTKTPDEMPVEETNLLPDGWYQAAFKKVEFSQTKATQDRLKYQLQALAEEGNPDSAKGPTIFGQLLFDSYEDEDTYRESVAAKTGASGEALDKAVEDRMKIFAKEVSAFGFAVHGYDNFSAVPRKDEVSGRWILPDGTEPSFDESRALRRLQNSEAYNAAVAVANGDVDITRWYCFVKVHTDTYGGAAKNAVKRLSPHLPKGAELLFP